MTHMHSYLYTLNNNESAKCLLVSSSITAIFTIIEIIGSLVSDSLTLLADAGHMLVDVVSQLLALFAIYFAHRAPNTRYTFGWLRLTTLTGFVNALTLIIMMLLIIFNALLRFQHLQPVSGITMVAISVAGLIANVIVLYILHRSSSKKNLNLKIAKLHVIGDLFCSAGNIVTALIIFYTGWIFIDPIFSILIASIVLRSAWILFKESTNELLEGTPISLDILALQRSLCHSIQEVYNVHHVHVWQIGEKPIITLHVQVIEPYNHDLLLSRIQHFLEHKYEILHSTIQMEYQYCKSIQCHIN